MQPRRNHFGIVKDKEVFWGEQISELVKGLVFQSAWLDHKKSALAAAGQGRLGDELAWQLEVKVGELE